MVCSISDSYNRFRAYVICSERLGYSEEQTHRHRGDNDGHAWAVTQTYIRFGLNSFPKLTCLYLSQNVSSIFVQTKQQVLTATTVGSHDIDTK